MNSITYAEAENNLTDVMDQVCLTKTPISIAREGKDAVVLLSYDDYTALFEAACLLENFSNSKEILNEIGSK